MFIIFFFFKQKTAYEMRISDWSSDVCSSDLQRIAAAQQFGEEQKRRRPRCRHFLFSASRSRRSSGRAVTLQKADHTIVEGVVAITGDHVSGTNHVVDFQRRQVLAKLLYAGLGDDVKIGRAHV